MNLPQKRTRTQNSSATQPSLPVLQHITDTTGGGAYTPDTTSVTNFEVSFSASEENSPPPPFSRGQRVVALSRRRDRQQWTGRIGKVATCVKGSSDNKWTIYVTFPNRNQAVAFLESELGLVLEGCLQLIAAGEEVAA